MTRHVNIPIFIPHLGCPNQCVFCNQRTISGTKEFKIEDVKEQIDLALSSIEDGAEVEIAFFGGSFTGIDYDLMCELLSIAYGYIKDGKVGGIRCSTRPDYINEKILDTLKNYGVRVIELGLQSTDDEVLLASKRGHTASVARDACLLIKKYGFILVGQMMIGLPESTPETEMKTAEFIKSVGADAARIYPTVVFYGTELKELAHSGRYTPITVEEAVSRSAEVFGYFTENGIKVIRIGLCASENLASADTYYAGPNHPALGEMIIGEYYYQRASEMIRKANISDEDKKRTQLTISVATGRLSAAIGQHRKNKIRLTEDFGFRKICFKENAELSDYEISVFTERIAKCI